MPEIVVKLPDIGEGITEAEISEWLVAPDDLVAEDDLLVVVLTDKAAVEIPSIVSGRVTWLAAEAGELLPVGAPLLKVDVLEGGDSVDAPATTDDNTASHETPERHPAMGEHERSEAEPARALSDGRKAQRFVKTLAAPAVRKRAADLGVNLASLQGSGRAGLVTHADLDHHLYQGGTAGLRNRSEGVEETKVIGLRRKIAEQLVRAHTSIPAITILEHVDVTELEKLRALMNQTRRENQPKLTLLPFLIRAIVLSRTVAPQVNAHYDEDSEILRTYAACHIGVATATEKGLMVPVMRHAEARTLHDMASEIIRLSEGARSGKLSHKELSGSSMTITSLGALGAVASTPIVNRPEVAIVGVNRKEIRPVWDGNRFVPREMMNLSASFDHRIVDGMDAAQFIARLKEFMQMPALLFAGGEAP